METPKDIAIVMIIYEKGIVKVKIKNILLIFKNVKNQTKFSIIFDKHLIKILNSSNKY